MTTRRTPLNRRRVQRITPQAIEAFKKMEAADIKRRMVGGA